ncbi:MAG: hypothetical protein BGO53_08905 [Sphingobacteriales bacterium 39-19]|nr:hypothetical protein [Sphingobacteriales bacterium]OJW09933.1 MAG: hypothetical protein BGO53_08905 [Sphingobacteriales bacterium 39-19]
MVVKPNANGTPNAKKEDAKNLQPAEKTTDFAKVVLSTPNQPKVGISENFEERLHKLNKLFELQSKHSKLTQSDKKLSEFSIESGEGTELNIEDADGNEFTTKNPEIIQDVLQFLKEKIADKRKQLEELIRW